MLAWFKFLLDSSVNLQGWRSDSASKIAVLSSLERDLGGGTLRVPCLGSLCYEKVFSQCAFPSCPGSGQHVHSLHSLGKDHLPSSEQSCICPCLNTGTKTSVHRYTLFHIIYSHKWNGRKPQWTCAQSEAQNASHNTVPYLGSFQNLTRQDPEEPDCPCFEQEFGLKTSRSSFQLKFACDSHPH